VIPTKEGVIKNKALSAMEHQTDIQLKQIKDMTALVTLSKSKKAITPSWKGGSLPLTSYLTHFLRLKLSDALQAKTSEKELKFLRPLLQRQNKASQISREACCNSGKEASARSSEKRCFGP